MDANKFISVLSLALAAASAFSQANAQQWCERTTHAPLCQSITQADPRTNLETSLESIGTILKDKAVSTAVFTSAKISSLLRTTDNQQVIQILRECSQLYSKAIPSLKSADFNHFNYIGLVGAITDGSDAPHECKTSFEEPGLAPSPISGEVQSLIDICDTVLEIVNLRQCNTTSFC